MKTTTTSPARPDYPRGFRLFVIVLTAVSAAILELVDTSIVNVAIRDISGSLGASTTEVAWVITAYAISNLIIIPLTGFLSNLFGRKNYFTYSIILFTTASFLCGISSSLWMLGQISLGWTATLTGLSLMPGSLMTAATLVFTGKMIEREVNPKLFIVTGFAILFCFVSFMYFQPPDSSWRSTFFPLLIRGGAGDAHHADHYLIHSGTAGY